MSLQNGGAILARLIAILRANEANADLKSPILQPVADM